MTKLLFIFIGIPLLELMILIELGREIGFWPTIFLVIVTGVLGASLARSQGMWIWLEIQHELSQGNMPADKLVDGLLILIGGIVLLTPGLLTDIFGFMLLIPVTRNLFKRAIRKKFRDMADSGRTNFTMIMR
ncbi:MAG TPA: FxsA family protein [Candidatus Marinimicrobia bacterium]|nr:FxsA family protein [Candidatus Neomarinimicrobiota bacterium]HJL85090.1 FxsA family protein [Candidatus Neomarinimicrobiota bacterium]